MCYTHPNIMTTFKRQQSTWNFHQKYKHAHFRLRDFKTKWLILSCTMIYLSRSHSLAKRMNTTTSEQLIFAPHLTNIMFQPLWGFVFKHTKIFPPNDYILSTIFFFLSIITGVMVAYQGYKDIHNQQLSVRLKLTH